MNKILIVSLLSFFMSSYAYAASFDCNKASTSHEKMICNDPTLGALDGEMGRLYKQVLALDPQQLKEQRKFNKKYRGCSELDKCIRLVEGRNQILEYRVKAEQGNVGAQNNLGMMYNNGQGVVQDYVMAHMYFNIAGVSGDKSAIKNRGIVEKGANI
jgi:TPR repeat protein